MEFGGDGHFPLLRGERADIFRSCWMTDVGPVHERTELSRTLRADYAKLSLRSLMLLNGLALPGLPIVFWFIGIPFAMRIASLHLALGIFLAGLIAAVLAVMIGYVTLDVDVVRQKAERSAARLRIIQTEFSDAFSPDMAVTLDRVILREQRFWRTGVALAWAAAALSSISLVLFLAGGVVALRALP